MGIASAEFGSKQSHDRLSGFLPCLSPYLIVWVFPSWDFLQLVTYFSTNRFFKNLFKLSQFKCIGIISLPVLLKQADYTFESVKITLVLLRDNASPKNSFTTGCIRRVITIVFLTKVTPISVHIISSIYGHLTRCQQITTKTTTNQPTISCD